MTLDDFEHKILTDATKRFWACKVADDIIKENALVKWLSIAYTPPTRRQRFELKLKDWQQRIKDIWTILKGGDIHENCGY